MTGLPNWLSAALDSKLQAMPRATLRQSAQVISDTYRSGGSSRIIRSERDALAYAVVRMPATYAAVRAALAQAIEIVPDAAPRSLLDVGAGPGTATWAACDAWPSIERAVLIDSNPHLLELAHDLGTLRGGLPETVAAAADVAQGLTSLSPADVVLASYALTEIAPARLPQVLEQLWMLTARLLVLVEPGTPDGFARILTYRNELLGRGAQIIAPCSHEDLCPLASANRWCHFSARLPRSRDHLIVKGANVPYEDEKFSYLIAGKGFGDVARGRRILATPKVSKSAITLTLCAPGSTEDRVIARGQKDAYRAAKRCDWGDAVPS